MHAPVTGTIRYLTEAPPPYGEPVEVAPGLIWLRLPLPFALDHVNVWLLPETGGWTAIDTGANKPETKAIWERVLSSRKLVRLVATHGHPDHVGVAGWLVERYGVSFHSTLAEWLAPQVWRADGLQPMRPEVEQFYRGHGCPEPVLAKMKVARDEAPFRNHPLPAHLERIRDGDDIKLGGRAWRVLVNGGHADEHASFHCEADKILIAGDQILSKISPVIGVFASQPHADPLAHYYRSLTRLRELPADTLVLPSHGLPFMGLRERIDQLVAHHDERLDTLEGLLGAPKTCYELAESLFAKALRNGQTVLALAETLSHLSHLANAGRARRLEGERVRFARV